MWQKCVFQWAWEEHVEKWTKKIWICVKPIGKFKVHLAGNQWMFLPLTPGLKIHCFEDAGGIIEGHLPLKLLSFTQKTPKKLQEWSGSPPNSAQKKRHHSSRKPSKTAIFPNRILDQAGPQPGPHTNGWRVPGKRRKAEASPAGNRERIAVNLPKFSGKWWKMGKTMGKIITRSFSEPVSKSDDETLLCLAGLALCFFPTCTACEMVT